MDKEQFITEVEKLGYIIQSLETMPGICMVEDKIIYKSYGEVAPEYAKNRFHLFRKDETTPSKMYEIFVDKDYETSLKEIIDFKF